MRSRAELYQIWLIISGLLVTALFAIFFYREIFPEYKIYQKDYIALEEFRSTYTQQSPPDFKIGIKQLVLEREDKGPPVIDRCTSCHVALQIPYFSPTKIAYDLNGNIIRNQDGDPIQIANEEYIWNKLDETIAALRDEKVNEQLNSQGNTGEVQNRLRQAKEYEALKTAHVGHQVYDVTKVLRMHPLIGNETRPFEFHPVEEYGCTSCHNGNGRGLTTERAHGPVFDEQYEVENRGPVPKFIESDPENDPPFSKVFNAKPGHELLFQTQPIFVGALVQAKCMQCHQTGQMQLETAALSTSRLSEKKHRQFEALKDSLKKDKESLQSLLEIKKRLEQEGYERTVAYLETQEKDYTLSSEEIENVATQIKFLKEAAGDQKNHPQAQEKALQAIDRQLNLLSSSSQLKEEALNLQRDLLQHAEDTQKSFQSAVEDQNVISALTTDVDELTRNYQRGKELYFSQACYACHRISGLARGGVGPELTLIGEHYPWYIKESIVWPQADLVNSTMPNMRLDHQEVEDLMAFLLAQRGSNKAVAQSAYQASLQSWEAGRKLPWEKPVSPAQMHDLRFGMTVFATEGCAACHRLMGYDSNVGFAIEKEKYNFDEYYEEQRWFQKLFPETIRVAEYDEPLPGSSIIAAIEKHADEIDQRIVSNVRKNAILEEINQKYPEAIESLYTNFRFASRAKNHHFETLAKNEKDPEKLAKIHEEQAAWKDRVHRVQMMFIQTYGLGRLIGPRPNWSGIYRSDEWLMEHFKNPSAHVPRSIMPVMPFDDTKFYALTHMLDVLAPRNRDRIRQIWANRGFDPAEAYEIHCTQCHGQSRGGNGPESQWIYPLPKNLLNPDFLRNLTKERAFFSIKHGVKGTPMPPWGEIAEDKPPEVQELIHGVPVLTDGEIKRLVDWLFEVLPGGEVIRETEDVLKWKYQPHDVLQELKQEGGKLEGLPEEKERELKPSEKVPELELPQENVPPPREESVTSSLFPTGEGYYAAIRPEIYPKRDVAPENKDVEDVFDIVPNPEGWPDPASYYIKRKYYTPYNIQEGQKFFLLNCAVCHGNEGDGSGARAGPMQEAKPRMLTNIDWTQSRDDLRFLRSIKYGVPGTAMTPWGDLTNAIQRLQLVIFIRHLSQDQNRRSQLDGILYQVFENAQLTIEEARIATNKHIQKLQAQIKEVEARQNDLERSVAAGNLAPDEALQNYQKELQLKQQLKQLQSKDEKFLELKRLVKRERDLYFNLGVNLMTKEVPDDILQTYFSMVLLNKDRFQIQEDHLTIRDQKREAEQIRQYRQKVVQEIEKRIVDLKQQQKALEAKFDSDEKSDELATIQTDLNSYTKLKNQLMIETEEALRLVQQQKAIEEKL